MSKPAESILVEKHYIELIREASVYYEKQAFTWLQVSLDPTDRFAACEDMELWKSVQILIAQRDKLHKYIGLLIKSDGEEQTVNAAKEYLEQIGLEL